MDRKTYKKVLDWFCLALILIAFGMVGCVIFGYVSIK